VSGVRENSGHIRDKDNEVHDSDQRHGRVHPQKLTWGGVGGIQEKRNDEDERTYTDLLVNLLVHDNTVERSGYCQAVIAGHQILKGHLQRRLLH